jgi:hypothetical protein
MRDARSNTIIATRSCSRSRLIASRPAEAIRTTCGRMLALTSSSSTRSTGRFSVSTLCTGCGLPCSRRRKSRGPRPVITRFSRSTTCASTRTSDTSLRNTTGSSARAGLDQKHAASIKNHSRLWGIGIIEIRRAKGLRYITLHGREGRSAPLMPVLGALGYSTPIFLPAHPARAFAEGSGY